MGLGPRPWHSFSGRLPPFTVTPTAGAPLTTTITANGVAVTSGTASAPIALSGTSLTPADIAVTPIDAATIHFTIIVTLARSPSTYVKASNAGKSQNFGGVVALSNDTLAGGASYESSAATGINGNHSDGSAPGPGAVYVFVRVADVWSQQAYVRASNARASASFGANVALSGDTLAVAAPGESSAATGIDGNQSDASASNAGASYVFTRANGVWSQQAYVKASNTRANARFGIAIAISGDTLAVGADQETSAATGINGDPTNTSAPNAGAAYVYP